MAQGYVISERDYQRLERAIRFVERMADVNFRRKHPVHMFGFGDGGSIPYPTKRNLISTASFQITSAHKNSWLFTANDDAWSGQETFLTMPPSADAVAGDIYWMACLGDSTAGRYRVWLTPNEGQTIVLPYVEDLVYGSGKSLRLSGVYELYTGHCQYIFICLDPTTWIAWSACTVVIETPS